MSILGSLIGSVVDSITSNIGSGNSSGSSHSSGSTSNGHSGSSGSGGLFGSIGSAIGSLFDGSSSSSNSNGSYGGSSSSFGSNSSYSSVDDSKNAQLAQSIKDAMYANGQKWGTADAQTQKQLASQNIALGEQLKGMGYDVYRDNGGTWYINQGGSTNKLFDTTLYDESKDPYSYSSMQNAYLQQLQNNPWTNMQQPLNTYANAAYGVMNNNLAQLDAQRQDTNDTYDDNARQAYIAMRRSRMYMPDQLAAAGYTGGLSESSLLGLESNYQNNLMSNEQARQNALREIGLQESNIRAQTESDIANYQAQLELQAMQAAQEYNQWLAEMQREDQRYQDSLRLSQQQNDEARRQYEIELALQLGDYEKLAELGYNSPYLQTAQDLEMAQMQAELNQLAAQARAAQEMASAQAISSSGSSGGISSSRRTNSNSETAETPSNGTDVVSNAQKLNSIMMQLNTLPTEEMRNAALTALNLGGYLNGINPVVYEAYRAATSGIR